MDIVTKQQAFEYLLTQLLSWGNEMCPAVSYSSFTRLKALKLLFFTAAVRNEQGCDLLDVFDNFYALPNGPVESDIYNAITADQLTFYSFKDFAFTTKQQYSPVALSEELRNRINNAVECLKRQNRFIVSYRADQLVDLSHTWQSWKNSIQIASLLGKGSYRMDKNKIRTDRQIFVL